MITRYKQDYRGDFFEHPEGEWCKYTDVATEVELKVLRWMLTEWAEAGYENSRHNHPLETNTDAYVRFAEAELRMRDYVATLEGK